MLVVKRCTICEEPLSQDRYSNKTAAMSVGDNECCLECKKNYFDTCNECGEDVGQVNLIDVSAIAGQRHEVCLKCFPNYIQEVQEAIYDCEKKANRRSFVDVSKFQKKMRR